MNEQELRTLFTKIGCITEDASVIALIWTRDDLRSVSDRVTVLRGAYGEIGALLDVIEANVR